MVRLRCMQAAVVLAASLHWLSLSAQEAAPAATPQPPVSALWKSQEIKFYFQSQTTFYSCSSLEDKVEQVLEALGAQVDVKVRAADCHRGVVRMPYVLINLASPVEATPRALAEWQKGRSTRELAAKVKGKRAQDTEPSEQFPAQWKRISLGRGTTGLQPGDCELLDELQRKVLPKLALRVIKDDVRCSPNQLTLGQPQLEVDALVAMPKPDEAKPAGS